MGPGWTSCSVFLLWQRTQRTRELGCCLSLHGDLLGSCVPAPLSRWYLALGSPTSSAALQEEVSLNLVTCFEDEQLFFLRGSLSPPIKLTSSSVFKKCDILLRSSFFTKCTGMSNIGNTLNWVHTWRQLFALWKKLKLKNHSSLKNDSFSSLEWLCIHH